MKIRHCFASRSRKGIALAAAVLVVVGAMLSVAGAGTAAMHGAEDGELRAEGARQLIVEIGPLDLPAGSSHHEAPQPPLSAFTFPLDTYLHGYEVEMVDSAGTPVSRHVLHHVNLIVPQKRELFSNIMLRLGAAGPETGPVLLPRMFAMPVSKGDSLLVTAMFHNPEARDYQGVRMRIRLRHTPADTRLRPFRVKPFYVDVMPPDGKHAFDLPQGRSERSWEGSPSVPGRILGMGGHLHRYGILLRFEDVTSGRVLWEAEPRFDEKGRVKSMPTKRYFLRLGLPVDTGRVYRLTAIYDNQSGDVIPDGGMGTLGGVFLPSRKSRWPGVDAAHPQYLRDWQLLRGELDDHRHHVARRPRAAEPAHEH